MNRTTRSKADLTQELIDQLSNLRMACSHYDSGQEFAGKSIGVCLRVLLYSSMKARGRQSRGLLDQLGYRAGRFTGTSIERETDNIAPTAGLLCVSVTDVDVRWEPRLVFDPYCKTSKRLLFADWWNEIVVVDSKEQTFSRMSLVMHVADTDGGAHVDGELENSYMDLSRFNSMGIEFGAVPQPLVGRPVLACLRQIAQEVFATLLENVESLRDYVQPIIPEAKIYTQPPAGQGQRIILTKALPDKYINSHDFTATATLTPLKRID